MARKSLRSKASRQNRKSILNTANSQHFDIGTARRHGSHGPSDNIQHDSSDSSMNAEASDNLPPLMDVEPHSDSMDVDTDMLNMLGRIFSMTNLSRKVFAARTKPIKKHGQKRVGAKKAKKLEISESGSFELSPSDATMYRALAARCN